MDWGELERRLNGRIPDLMDGGGHFAVLVPIVHLNEIPHLLYEVRAKNMRLQPGEICFPGGKMEGAETPVQAALRESWEELAITPEQVHVMGEMDFIVHRANFIIHPVLAQVELSALNQLICNQDEVAEVFAVPLRHLQSASEEVYHCTLIPQPQQEFTYDKLGLDAPYSWRPGREEIPIYRWKQHIIWGVTGKITRHVLSLMGGER